MEKDSGHGWRSGHASLCVLGWYLRRIGFFDDLEHRVRLRQKALRYTPVQKLEMIVVALLAGAKAIYHTGLTLRVEPALQRAFELPGCADQSTLAATLNAATDEDVAAVRAALGASFARFSQTARHDRAREMLTLDVDLSPMPASARAEGSERGYMGRCRSKTGRKLVRVRSAHYGEILWEDVAPGKAAESLGVLQMAVAAVEELLGLGGDDDEAQERRARVEWRLDGGWGSEATLNWLLGRGYQVTGKFKSSGRVAKLVRGVDAWEATASPGREVARVAEPAPLVRPTQQYAVRTPSKDRAGGYYYAVLVATRDERDMHATVLAYDRRAGMESQLKEDKHGLGLAVIRKRKLAAQKLVVLLIELAHNLLIWARRWLALSAPRLAELGVVRLVQEVWAAPGHVALRAERPPLVRLQPAHPRARDLTAALRALLTSASP